MISYPWCVSQVAEETGLRETLIAQLLRTLAAQIPLNHQLPPSPLKAGPGENVCSSPGELDVFGA